jgi:hypothetical protein
MGVDTKTTVKGETFNILKFEAHEGTKLGSFEVATKRNNLAEKFQTAFSILEKSGATINSRYHGVGYAFAYWIYEESIFRKKLGSKQ